MGAQLRVTFLIGPERSHLHMKPLIIVLYGCSALCYISCRTIVILPSYGTTTFSGVLAPILDVVRHYLIFNTMSADWPQGSIHTQWMDLIWYMIKSNVHRRSRYSTQSMIHDLSDKGHDIDLPNYHTNRSIDNKRGCIITNKDWPSQQIHNHSINISNI